MLHKTLYCAAIIAGAWFASPAAALDDGPRLTFSKAYGYSKIAYVLYGLNYGGGSCNNQTAVPSDEYSQPAMDKNAQWCPAIQRIYDPTSPFAPRQYLAHMRVLPYTDVSPFYVVNGHIYDYRGTDREYSWATSQLMIVPQPMTGGGSGTAGGTSGGGLVIGPDGCPYIDPGQPPSSSSGSPTERKCNVGVKGYSSYLGTNDTDTTDFYKVSRPAVQCGVVPVDLMNFTDTRLRSFDICISQRIALNYGTWLEWLHGDLATRPAAWRNWQKSYVEWANSDHPSYETGPEPPFTVPCATRYFDADGGSNSTVCNATLTIQQCCSIITKPVVPMNALKIVPDTDVLAAMEKNSYTPIVEGYMAPNRTDIKEPRADKDEPECNGTTPKGKLTSAPNNWARYWCDLKSIVKLHEDIGKKWTPDNQVPDDFRFGPQDAMFFDPDLPGEQRGYARQYYDPFSGKYVGAYMPYMRHWDTGAESFMDRKYGSFLNTLPSYDIVVGVGREGSTKQQLKDSIALATAAGRPAHEITWLKSFLFKEGIEVDTGRYEEMGRYGGFRELNGDETMAFRYYGLMCLPRYEKLFKPFDGDNFALAKAGTNFDSPLIKNQPWPVGWQGYGSEAAANMFKGLGGLYNDGGVGSLDNARRGDVIVLNFKGDMGGYTRTYFVADTGNHPANHGALAPDYLYVVAWNAGKFPTSTGITDQIGMGQETMIFKETTNDNNAAAAVAGQKMAQLKTVFGLQEPSCVDGNYAKCVVPKKVWDSAVILRPSGSIRKCPLPQLVDTYNGSGRSMILHADAGKADASLFGYCINAGYDPPYQWRKEGTAGDFGGAGTGQATFTHFCPPGIPENALGGRLWPMGPNGAWGSCPSSSNALFLRGPNPALPPPNAR